MHDPVLSNFLWESICQQRDKQMPHAKCSTNTQITSTLQHNEKIARSKKCRKAHTVGYISTDTSNTGFFLPWQEGKTVLCNHGDQCTESLL